MVRAVASGKGGTGKTTFATNLALALGDLQFLDCDVEEPNAYHFLKPKLKATCSVVAFIPIVNQGLCSHCGQCVRFCKFNALALVKERLLVFPELCHSCGGCKIVCPDGAIREGEREIGTIQIGTAREGIEFIDGILNVGEPSGVPIIRRMKKLIEKGRKVIIDSPPGAACTMVETVSGVDYCILVTEPTPFGLNDLRIAVETLKGLHVPFGVVINRDGIGDGRVEEYCSKEGIELLLKIPDSREIAEGYSRGIPFIEFLPEWKGKLQTLYEHIEGVTG